jgi:hypothetical protein
MNIRPIRSPSSLFLFAPFAASLVCCTGGEGEGEGEPEDCDVVCEYVATIEGECDFVEEPDCDPDERLRSAREQCDGECAGGLSREACPNAVATYADCVDADAHDGECAIAVARYEELCLQTPGAITCSMFCVPIEIGCLSYEAFGYRGDACEAECQQAAEDETCREAQYDLVLCEAESSGAGYACGRLTPTCLAVAADVDDACATWTATTADPLEAAQCEGFAEAACGCGLFGTSGGVDPNCLPIARDRCLFDLGRDAGCAAASDTFVTCMNGIVTCTRDALRDACLDEWDTWSSTCE